MGSIHFNKLYTHAYIDKTFQIRLTWPLTLAGCTIYHIFLLFLWAVYGHQNLLLPACIESYGPLLFLENSFTVDQGLHLTSYYR